MAKLNEAAWINLDRAQLLLLDDHTDGLNILVQIITAFGARRFHRCKSNEEAKEVAAQSELHLIVINANLKESNAYEFITWLRQANLQPNSFTPTILVTGHTQKSNVELARDCGANSVIAKPVSPNAMLERILWIAREKRPYVKCATYVGPDRRFHDTGPPEGMVGRRYNDVRVAPQAVSPETVSDENPERAAG